MTEEQKKMRAFFADKISKKIVWGDDDTEKMLDFLDPVFPNSTPQEEAQHISKRVLDFTREFTEWESKQPKPAEPVKPMSDSEIEDLASMF